MSSMYSKLSSLPYAILSSAKDFATENFGTGEFAIATASNINNSFNWTLLRTDSAS